MIADKDLLSMQYARILAENAREAQKKLAGFPQEKLDQIVEHVAGEMEKHARELAVMSFEETDYGRWQDKLIKISFVCRSVLRGLRGMRCVGTLREDAGGNVLEVGVPLGVIVALCPSTSPVSTAIYKALLAIKSGNAIIFSLHPRAVRCMKRTLDLLIAAAEECGLPEGCVSYLATSTRSGTIELMRPSGNVSGAAHGRGRHARRRSGIRQAPDLRRHRQRPGVHRTQRGCPAGSGRYPFQQIL